MALATNPVAGEALLAVPTVNVVTTTTRSDCVASLCSTMDVVRAVPTTVAIKLTAVATWEHPTFPITLDAQAVATAPLPVEVAFRIRPTQSV